MSSVYGQHGESPGQSRAELESGLEELASLAGKPLPRNEFYAQWSTTTTQLSGAEIGPVWNTQRKPFDSFSGDRRLAAPPAVEHLVQSASTSVTPSGDSLFAAIVVDGRVLAVAEAHPVASSSPEEREQVGLVLAAACEIAADYEMRADRQAISGHVSFWQQLAELISEIASAETAEIADQMLVAAARELAPCDRATLVRCDGSRPRASAVSDTVSFDRRGGRIRSLESLSFAAAVQGTTLAHGEGLPSAPEEFQRPISDCLDQANARWLAAIPLLDSAKHAFAVLVIESGSKHQPGESLARAEQLAGICAGPLAGAYDRDQLPLLSVSRWLRDMFVRPMRSKWIRLGGIAAGAAVVIGSLALIPAELTIDARGQIIPVSRRHIYAPEQGSVVNVFVSHGEIVKKDQLLIQLDSDGLEQEAVRLRGELASIGERIDALNSARALNEATPGEDQRTEQFRISAELSQLGAVRSGLLEQLGIIEGRKQQLKILSPVPGEVLTWQAEELLAARPVSRGEHLLTVADTSGEWEVLLEIPADDAKAVRDMLDDGSNAQRFKFVVEASPGEELEAEIISVGQAVRWTSEGKLVVPATGRVTQQSRGESLPGAAVRAKLPGGNESLGYVWFRQVIRYVQLNWW